MAMYLMASHSKIRVLTWPYHLMWPTGFCLRRGTSYIVRCKESPSTQLICSTITNAAHGSSILLNGWKVGTISALLRTSKMNWRISSVILKLSIRVSILLCIFVKLNKRTPRDKFGEFGGGNINLT